jgi:hypothetical protein
MSEKVRLAEAEQYKEFTSQEVGVKGVDQAGIKRRRRPLILKVLVVGYLLLSWFGWMRMAGGLQDWSLLSAYLSGGMLVYLLAGGVLWGLAGLVSAISLWFGMSIAPWMSRVTASVCFIWYWLDRLFLTRTPLADTNLLFAGVATLLLLAFAMTVPALPRLKRFIGKGS